MTHTCNHLIATEPLPPKSIKQTTMKGGLIGVAQKIELMELKVIYQSEDGKYTPGMKVYVRGDLTLEHFGGVIHELNGVQFVLIPDKYIQLAISHG